MDIDPLPDLLKLDIPILLGIGERDESVPVESARFLAAQFEDAGKRNLTLRVYPGADHRLSANGVSHRREFFAELSRVLQGQAANTEKRARPARYDAADASSKRP